MPHATLVPDPAAHRGGAALLLALACAVSCAAEPPRPVEVVIPPLRAADVPPLQPKHAEERSDSCVLRGKSIVRRFELALTSAGRPYAVVSRARSAELTLAADGSMPLEVDAGGVTFSGFATKDDTPIFATKPVSIAGAIVPYGWAELRFAGLERGAVRVMLDSDWLPELVKGLEEEPAGVTPCDALSLAPGSFDPVAALGMSGADTATVSGEPVLVGRRADEDAALSLWPSPDSPPVARIAGRAGDRARIVLPLADVVVYGWVDGSQLARASKAAPLSPRRSAVRMDRAVFAPSTVACPRPVPITAEVDGEARFVGHVSAGKAMGLELDQDGGLLLAVEGSGFQPSGLAELRIRSDDLRGCRVKEAH
ncbi:MAG: hypothetical protein JNL21_33270 [Myxococcales bacterium]|nr:hypothetical protein [Myxococcales bacterium]